MRGMRGIHGKPLVPKVLVPKAMWASKEKKVAAAPLNFTTTSWRQSSKMIDVKRQGLPKNSAFWALLRAAITEENDPLLDCIVTCDEKRALYDNMKPSARWLNRDEAPNHFPKAKCSRKRPLRLFGGILPVLSTKFYENRVQNFCKELE